MSTVQELLTDEGHRLGLLLYELDSVVRRAGERALLYCGACQAVVPYSHAMAGLIPDWPYCPVHQGKPLMVRAALLDGGQHRAPQTQ